MNLRKDHYRKVPLVVRSRRPRAKGGRCFSQKRPKTRAHGASGAFEFLASDSGRSAVSFRHRSGHRRRLAFLKAEGSASPARKDRWGRRPGPGDRTARHLLSDSFTFLVGVPSLHTVPSMRSSVPRTLKTTRPIGVPPRRRGSRVTAVNGGRCRGSISLGDVDGRSCPPASASGLKSYTKRRPSVRRGRSLVEASLGPIRTGAVAESGEFFSRSAPVLERCTQSRARAPRVAAPTHFVFFGVLIRTYGHLFARGRLLSRNEGSSNASSFPGCSSELPGRIMPKVTK